MSKNIVSLDPRVTRANIPENIDIDELKELDQWETYEVFHQKLHGEQHVHVGVVHAPSAELALVFAKEQYARRLKCVNLWVVKTGDITTTSYEDADMFDQATDKTYREAYGYKVRDIISQFNKPKK